MISHPELPLNSKRTQQLWTWHFHLHFKSASEIWYAYKQLPSSQATLYTDFSLLLKAIPFFQLLRDSSWSYQRVLFSCAISKSYQHYSPNISKIWPFLTIPVQSIIISQPNDHNELWNCSSLLNGWLPIYSWLPPTYAPQKNRIIHFKHIRSCHLLSEIPLDVL